MQEKKHTRLGQHFLTRPEIAARIAEDACISKQDTVLEIGPGHGILTRELLSRAGTVIALEKDLALAEELQQTFAQAISTGTLHLVQNDIRSFTPSTLAPTPYTVIANIPYYITGLILRMFLNTEHQPTAMTLLMQREVAQRIVARDGKESVLSLSVKAYGMPIYMRTIKAGAFNPPPKVDSAVLSIRDISRKQFTSTKTEKCFFSLIHRAFNGKRKQIGNTLSLGEGVLEQFGVTPTARPETIPVETWIQIAEQLH